MLRSGMKESQIGAVDLPNIAKTQLELVLSFAALGRPKTFALPEELEQLEELVTVSRYLLEKDLCSLATAKLDEMLSKRSVDFSNWAETFAFATRLGLERLSEGCFIFWFGNAFLKGCGGNCRPENTNWCKLTSSNYIFKGSACGTDQGAKCILCDNAILRNRYSYHRCLVTGDSNCTHRSWPVVFDAALATTAPTFSVQAKAAIAELLSMGAADAIMFMLGKAKNNFVIFPDGLEVIMSPGFPAETFCDFIDSSKQAPALFKKLTEARGDFFLHAFRNLWESRFAGLVLLAAARGRFFSEEVMDYVQKAKYLDYCDENGSVLHEAVRMQSPSLVQLLVRKTDVNLVMCNETPLQVAVSFGNLDVIKILLKHGANPDLRGKNGETALHSAVTGKSVEITKLLLVHEKVDLNNSRASDGRTALHLAVSMRLVEVVAVLLAHEKIDSEARTHNGDSALLLACVSPAHPQLFEMLLDRTLCFAANNKMGSSALALLQREAKNCTDVARRRVLESMAERILTKLPPCAVQ